MAKLLKISERLLLGLGLAGDFFREVADPGGIMAASYQTVYGFTPVKYRKTSFYATVNRLLRSGYLERKIIKGEPVLSITSDGLTQFTRNFPLVELQNRKWDEKWRVVIFDIPEKERWKREGFRQKLIELGFGNLQESVMISPHPVEGDIRDFINAQDLTKYVFVFTAEASDVKDMNLLAERVWGLERLNNQYRRLVESFITDYQNPKSKKEFMNDYLELLVHDPYLPAKFLPQPWWGTEARKLLKPLIRSCQ